MPRNVTVQRPDTGVVGVELDDKMAWVGSRADLDQLHISALRVCWPYNGLAVPGSLAFMEHPEVVAV